MLQRILPATQTSTRLRLALNSHFLSSDPALLLEFVAGVGAHCQTFVPFPSLKSLQPGTVVPCANAAPEITAATKAARHLIVTAFIGVWFIENPSLAALLL
jgi:hypothetical protein